jgi:hypothetical protein
VSPIGGLADRLWVAGLHRSHTPLGSDRIERAVPSSPTARGLTTLFSGAFRDKAVSESPEHVTACEPSRKCHVYRMLAPWTSAVPFSVTCMPDLTTGA